MTCLQGECQIHGVGSVLQSTMLDEGEGEGTEGADTRLRNLRPRSYDNMRDVCGAATLEGAAYG